MRRQHECRAALADLGECVPEVPACDRVHAGRRLVEKHDRRVADQRDRRAQLALVATAAAE